MKPIDTTPAGQTEAIAFEFHLPHSAAKVWRALTDPALLSEWLLPVVAMKLEPGATFMFSAPPQPGWDGSVNCRFLEIETHRKLSYTWVVGEVGLTTVVTFTLVPTPSGTTVTMVQTGFTPSQKQNFGGARYGWRLMGSRLMEVLERLA